MRILKGRSKNVRRCQKKPKYENEEDKKKQKARDTFNRKIGRMDDGASKVYRKLGRSGYESFAKDLARLWWDMPLNVESSGLLMETSKCRLRGGPVPTTEDTLLTHGLPQPHYTLKILRTAFKIYRLRLERRYHTNKDVKTTWLWTDQKNDEEPKWAYIIDRPLLEQYILMLNYIRNLASKLAWEMGHKEVICSETPYRVIEKLHPLKRLDFREAKHFLPQPFITSSDSDTQMKINRELIRLDRALTIASKEKEQDLLIPPGMIAAEEVSSSSSTTSTSLEEIQYDEKMESHRRSTLEELKEQRVTVEGETKLLERDGQIYVSYKDPGSEESIFIDFADLPSYVQPNRMNSFYDSLSLGEETIKISEEQIEEKKQDDNKNKKKGLKKFKKKNNEEESKEKLNTMVPNKANGNREDANGTHSSEQVSNERLHHLDSPGPSTRNFNTRPNREFHYIDENDKHNKPGPSHKDAEYENTNEEDDQDTVTLLPSFQTFSPRGDGDLCILTRNYHRNKTHITARRTKERTVQALNTEEIELSLNEGYSTSSEKLLSAGGDAAISIRIADEMIRECLAQTAVDLKALISNIPKFLQRSDQVLDRMKDSLDRIESILPEKNSYEWDIVKRHMKIVIKRLPQVTISG